MKIIEKITLVLYSVIMLILSILMSLLVFGWLDMGLAGNLVYKLIVADMSSKIILGISILFILLSIKCIFFSSSAKKEKKSTQGVLLENESGKLLISKETIENLVDSVALDFENTEQVTTKIELDKENNIIVYINLTVNSEAVIKDLSSNLQSKIKEKIKVATDLEVKEVNIVVKKVTEKQEGQVEE